MRLQGLNVQPRCIHRAVCMALATMMAAPTAWAQEKTDADVQTVLVVGIRGSQQGSIAAKKNAATAVDVIVAEDIGSFPDRNVAEAISRIAGVSLERGDFGEGRNVDVRGNGPDLTRVEIDGMGVVAAGGTDMNGGGGGRGVELRELPSDLIQSVTVVKGSTADMTEGSLGGGIIIKTRTGLDFKKQFVSARVSGTRNSLGDKKWTPNLNMVYANKFMDGRLGVVANLSKTHLKNEGHFQQYSLNGNAGYYRNADFDNSPEKTFTYHPESMNFEDASVSAPKLFPLAAGGNMSLESPEEILTKAAAAKTKQECLAAFPVIPTADLNRINTSTNRNAALNWRADAALTCLNQWNDYTPSGTRSIVKRNDDRRLNRDIRFDFKVNNNLSVYAKYAKNTRTVYDEFLTLDRGTPNVGGGLTTDTAGTVAGPGGYIIGRRNAVPNTSTSIYGGYQRSGTSFVEGVPSNIVPGSVVVDKSHHVTSFVMNDAGFFVDNISNDMVSNSDYKQAGGTYRNGSFRAEFMTSKTDSYYHRGDTRLNNIGYTYGQAKMTFQPGGAWQYDMLSAATDQTDGARYAQLLAPANATATLNSRQATLQFLSKSGVMGEEQSKIDTRWEPNSDALPFLRTLKLGAQRREYVRTDWGNGGYTVRPAANGNPAITVPGVRVDDRLIACQEQTTTGAAKCPNFGANPVPNSRTVNYTFTQQGYADFLREVMSTKRVTGFFDGASNLPSGMPQGWAELDVKRAIALLNVPNLNHDCDRFCMGSDGNIYEQPNTGASEKITSGYFSFDFDLTEIPWTSRTLPFGMELNGNMGWRYVHADVMGRGQLTFTSITKTSQFDPNLPDAPAGISSLSMTKQTGIRAKTTDIMPIFNMALWVIPDKVVVRYNRAKTIARPSVGNLFPSGTCTFDQRTYDANQAIIAGGGDEDLFDMRCTGNFGNPGLLPTTNKNQNLSIEWYPNKDSQLAFSYFDFRGIIGGARRVSVSNADVFAGTDVTDPQTGQSLAGTEFGYSTLVNATPVSRTGWEVSGRTAFTWAPWFLRYTGVDANYSASKPKGGSRLHREATTGDQLTPQGVPDYSWNASLWYDDGKLSARASWQVVAQRYLNIGPQSSSLPLRNYPMLGVIANITGQNWNPASANFANMTRYLDVKLAYKILPSVEVFAEARNAGRNMVIRSQGPYNNFENGSQTVNEFFYTGTRVTAGINLKY